MSGIGTSRRVIHTSVGSRRLFTPERAGRAIVLVKRIVEDLARSHHRAQGLQESLEAAQAAGKRLLAARAAEDLLRVAATFRQCLRELDEVGAEVKDWRLGFVDFPARDRGREIRLCWRWGERGVAWWHGPDERCSQRRPLATL